jgi:hypothetical protein
MKQQQKEFDNLHHLADRLKDELPLFFTIDNVVVDVFADDVVFKDAHLPAIRGKDKYGVFLHAIQDTARLLYDQPGFSVQRVTVHTNEHMVKVRWQIWGKAKKIFTYLGGSPYGCYDGISKYYVEPESGKVSLHEVDYNIPISTGMVTQASQQMEWLNAMVTGGQRVAAPASCPFVPADQD